MDGNAALLLNEYGVIDRVRTSDGSVFMIEGTTGGASTTVLFDDIGNTSSDLKLEVGSFDSDEISFIVVTVALTMPSPGTDTFCSFIVDKAAMGGTTSFLMSGFSPDGPALFRMAGEFIGNTFTCLQMVQIDGDSLSNATGRMSIVRVLAVTKQAHRLRHACI